jgi:RNA-directed DNA polymerase
MSDETTTIEPTPGTEAKLPDWAGIAEAGGIDAWVVQELKRRDLWDEDVDTSTLSDKERKRYKARREEERRVRKILRRHAWAEFRRAHVVHVGRGIWYHDTVDVDRYDIAELDARRVENHLPELKNAEALARALEIDVPRLRWLCFQRDVDTGTHYHRWTIPKRSGGERLISAPKPDLKRCQTWIAAHVTEHLPVHGAAHGFVAGRSIVTNAQPHAGADVVIKFDLKDFYPTVTLSRVKGLFRKAGYGEQVATLLALLCTESPREIVHVRGRDHHVSIGPRACPQGAPTSPTITNAVSRRLDSRLAGLAAKLGLRYTRYADDLTFSWRRPSADAGRKAPVGLLLRAVGTIVREEGFELHGKKTRVMRRSRRQSVTGLVVNEAPGAAPVRPDRSYVRRLRAAIHQRELGRAGKGESLEQLRGMAAFVYMSDPRRGRQLLERLAALGTSS